MPILNRRQARVAIENRTPFKGSNITGVAGSDWYGTGRLNDEESDLLIAARNSDKLEYVVKSYNTPIAWYRSDTGWYRVEEKFSVTTSCHMGLTPLPDRVNA